MQTKQTCKKHSFLGEMVLSDRIARGPILLAMTVSTGFFNGQHIVKELKINCAYL